MATSAQAAEPSAQAQPAPTYADLVDLADGAGVVAHVVVKRQTTLPPERAADVAPGFARLYVEAATVALLGGRSGLGGSVAYLVDVPLDARGKVPRIKKQDFVLFARAVPGRPGELQLLGRHAQLPWSPALEARLRPVLTALAAPDAPPRVTGVRDALSVPGNLVGESETQIFLSVANGEPVSLNVVRRPDMAPTWGVSWSEIVDQAARPPARDTLEWYRLACFLPPALPAQANLAREPDARAQAAADYRLVLQGLGACPRNLAEG
ncbi:MAG: hypothetical protein ACTHKM_07245 [Tsuneonella sp.]